MPLSENGGGGFSATMPVQPMYGGGYPMMGGGGMGGFGFGGDWAWILLLLLIGGNGWGMGGFGGGMMWPMMGMGMMDGGFGLYPWLNNSQNINSGFRDNQLSNQISGLRSDVTGGFSDVALGIAGVNQNICQTGNGIQNALCQGFAGVNQGVAQGFAQAEIANNARQIADMQQNFAAQTATLQGFNGVGTGIADLKYTVAAENCNDRTAAAQNTRDIIDAQTRGTQAILDKLCALELDGVKGQLAAAQRENVGLQNQLNMANLAASQTAQTATFQQGLNQEVDALYNRLSNCPVPTVPVYGRQPIFTCNNNGCGCGNNTGFVA